MRPAPAPSRYILQKAWKLGQKMAYQERRLRPDVDGAHQYPSFSLFRSVHRHRLESLPPFARWDEKLQFLIEREASGCGMNLEDPKEWDIFYRFMAGPIRSSFWYGWELIHGLEGMYKAEVESFEKTITRREVLHVYTPPAKPRFAPSALPEGEELRVWDRMATRLFDEMNGDANEKLWDGLPANAPFAPLVAAENV